MLVELTQRLKALHLYGMAAELAEMGAERARKPEAPEIWLDRLVEAETVDRQARSLRYQLHAAKFPVHRDLASFHGRNPLCPSSRSGSWRLAPSWRRRTT